jgi:GGDEF domain-containing protein
LLPETDHFAAEFVIGKLHMALQHFGGKLRVPVTCSIGAATFTGDLVSLEYMLDEADRAMYAAKKNGKAQVVHAEIA